MPSPNISLSDLRARLNGLAPKLAQLRVGAPGSLSLGKLGSGSRSAGPRLVTGLDIEPGQVIAAEVHLNGGVRVVRAGGIPIPSDVVRDGEVADVEALTEALKTVFAEHKLSRQVRVGVANQRIMVRTIELPPIADPKELEAAVRFKAQDEIPMPPESVVLDFHSLGVVDTMAGPRQRILLVAARRDMVERLLSALDAAGLRPEGIDLAGFALIRSLHRSGSDPEAAVMYLHVSGLTNLVVSRGVSCVFTRVLGTGLEAIATSVAERCVVSIEDARALVFRVGMSGGAAVAVEGPAPDSHLSAAPAGPVPAPAVAEGTAGVENDATIEPMSDDPEPAPAHAGPDQADTETEVHPGLVPAVPRDETASGAPTAAPSARDHEIEATVRAAVSDGVRLIIAEVRNSLDYHLGHLGTAGEGGVKSVVLSGPAVGVPGLVDALAAELKLPLSVGEVAVGDAQGLAGVPASRLAVAAGLAVSEVAP